MRLSDLYGELAASKGLELHRNNSSELTREFQLWCMKLSGVDASGFKSGVDSLELQIEDNASKGIKSYPPSYAEFKGLCCQPETKAIHRSWAGLPKPTMSNDAKKTKMAEILGRLKK